MNNSPICCGCFVNQPFNWANDKTEFCRHCGSKCNVSRYALLPINPEEIGLTSEEKECLAHLVDSWNSFQKLTGKHPSDDVEFCRAIHDAQKMIALRVARRVDKTIWGQYE